LGSKRTLSGPEVSPINTVEEGMGLDLLVAHALLGISDEAVQEASNMGIHLESLRVLKVLLVPDNLPVGDIVAVGGEGRVAEEHLKHDHPDGPVVTFAAIPGFEENLRRNVVGGADC